MIPNKIIPCGNTIVCKKVSSKSEHLKCKNNFYYKVEEDDVPEFEIIDMHFLTDDDKNKFKFKISDIVYSGATGTPVKLTNIADEYFLFNPDYIFGKKFV